MTDTTLIDAIRSVAAVAVQSADILVPEWLPEGRRRGSEWVSRNPTRADRHAGSFSVSLNSGRWHDFATGDGGGDLVALAAYLWNVRQSDAARLMADRLGLVLPGKPDALPIGTRAAQQARADAARRELALRKAAEQEQRAMLRQRAACRAFDLLHDATAPDPYHPYLTAKQVPPYGLYQHCDDLLVPLHTVCGKLVNVQTIDPDGRKLFLRDGQMQGAFHLIGALDFTAPDAPPHEVYICEGWATGAALFQCWDVHAVACAMNAGNLKHVARVLRERYGHGLALVIAGDDDRNTPGNPGQRAANEAALLAGGMVIFPEWPPGAPADLSDFNDLMQWEMGA
ncbi:MULTISPECIES: toprim domain-containing protein [unclassified Brenneria]|uniref:toprim domain-containing protein n=1 Tax=unclassified Brenneria TaxID=2634434 RepID=UPI0029C5F11F|nr:MULTISPECIES: toprim domain-containing protein [unclassified Brenneria]MDX5627315.1 toprim domain-containing protein [Brenneria sp. L3-3Z]MDX5694529.1 toprim domain-containing protein [Brenneria sp. L4-2C]